MGRGGIFLIKLDRYPSKELLISLKRKWLGSIFCIVNYDNDVCDVSLKIKVVAVPFFFFSK